MNAKVKTFLIIAAKQAIVAGSLVVTNIWHDRSAYNLSTAAGWRGVTETFLVAIAMREAVILGPKILAWANSPTPGE